MKYYTAKSSDTVDSIAEKFGVPKYVLLDRNPFLEVDQHIAGGEIILIPPQSDYIDDVIKEAEDKLKEAEKALEERYPTNDIVPKESITLDWGSFKFSKGQLGIAIMVADSNIIKREKDKGYKKDRAIKKNSTFKVYGETKENNGMFAVGNEQYVLKSKAYFMPLPADLKKELDKKTSESGGKGSVGQTIDTEKVDVTDINLGATEETKINTNKPQELPQLMMPGYRRSRLQVKREDGGVTNLELRVLGMTRSRANNYQPSQTNTGWSIHVGGASLGSINVNAVFLDTLSNREYKDYNKIYKTFIQPRTFGKYFESPIVSFIHKNTEYKGFITSDTIADASTSPLSQSFSFSFLVLTENELDSKSEVLARFTVPRKSVDEITFLSDLSNMLANPITGKRFT